MKRLGLVFLTALSSALAQPDLGKWHTVNCPEEVGGATAEAIEVARDAVEVLESPRVNDEKVQAMLKIVLGDISDTSAAIPAAIRYLRGVASYDPVEARAQDVKTNQDVMVFCDGSEYELFDKNDPSSRVRHILHKRKLSKENSDGMKDCYSGVALGVSGRHMAGTYSSNRLDKDALEAQNGAIAGQTPDARDFYTILSPDTPNTIDICRWYQNVLGKKWPWGIAEDDIETVQSNNFLDSIVFEGTYKAIDGLKSSLTGTMLHELTHTNRGGLSKDVIPGACYGFVCVGKLKDVNNADSLTMLAIMMHLFKFGHYVNEYGKVHPV